VERSAGEQESDGERGRWTDERVSRRWMSRAGRAATGCEPHGRGYARVIHHPRKREACANTPPYSAPPPRDGGGRPRCWRRWKATHAERSGLVAIPESDTDASERPISIANHYVRTCACTRSCCAYDWRQVIRYAPRCVSPLMHHLL